MKLFKISQSVNNVYDTYDSAIVCAKDKKEAKYIHPQYGSKWNGKDEDYSTWCSIKDVKVEYIGEAKTKLKKGVVCASFHAG